MYVEKTNQALRAPSRNIDVMTRNSKWPGPKVIKLFSYILNSAEHDIYPAH